MFNRTNNKSVTVLVLLAWMFQVSVALASGHQNLVPEQLDVQAVEHLHSTNIELNSNTDTNDCHSNSVQNCDNGFCASCLFVIPTGLNTQLINVVSINIIKYSHESLLSYHSSFYRPPQIY